jgi:NAD(P)-dependent dehydrogenase (short-subunit alcohol dehydrogenase family)
MNDRVVMITGGSRGIGAAVARAAAKDGYRVAINYAERREPAERLIAERTRTGARAVAVKGDVSRHDDVVRMFDLAEEQLGPVTALVNNAGITGRSSAFAQADPETIKSCIDVNVTGAIFVAREAARRMIPRREGNIVNISSAASTMGSPGEYVWYAASKGAIDSLTIGLAKELATHGIRVNAVQPGMVETEIHDLSSGDPGRVERIRPMIPMQRIGKPEEIADAVMYLLSDKSSYVTGAILRVSGGR